MGWACENSDKPAKIKLCYKPAVTRVKQRTRPTGAKPHTDEWWTNARGFVNIRQVFWRSQEL